MKKIVTVRASSFGKLFDCGFAFEGDQILKLHKPSSLRAWLGTSIHAGTAAFDIAKLNGDSISADDAAGVLVKMLWEPSEDVDLKDPKLTMREAERIALVLHSRYCAEIAPKMQYESVEMALQPLDIDCGDGLIIRLTGTMDRARVVRSGMDKLIADLKTGGRLISDGVVSTKGRAAQLGTYQLLSEHTDGVPTEGAQIIALQTTTKSEVGISKIFDARKMMLGDEYTKGLLEMAATTFKTGNFMPNPQSVLCSKTYCSRWDTCSYHE